MGSNREKSNIAVAILEKLPFLKGNKIISYFGGSNNIFAECILSTTNLVLSISKSNSKSSYLFSFK